jgi:hypothetical protein
VLHVTTLDDARAVLQRQRLTAPLGLISHILLLDSDSAGVSEESVAERLHEFASLRSLALISRSEQAPGASDSHEGIPGLLSPAVHCADAPPCIAAAATAAAVPAHCSSEESWARIGLASESSSDSNVQNLEQRTGGGHGAGAASDMIQSHLSRSSSYTRVLRKPIKLASLAASVAALQMFHQSLSRSHSLSGASPQLTDSGSLPLRGASVCSTEITSSKTHPPPWARSAVLALQHAGPMRKSQIVHIARQYPLRILLAEDNIINQKMMVSGRQVASQIRAGWQTDRQTEGQTGRQTAGGVQ